MTVKPGRCLPGGRWRAASSLGLGPVDLLARLAQQHQCDPQHKAGQSLTLVCLLLSKVGSSQTDPSSRELDWSDRKC